MRESVNFEWCSLCVRRASSFSFSPETTIATSLLWYKIYWYTYNFPEECTSTTKKVFWIKCVEKVCVWYMGKKDHACTCGDIDLITGFYFLHVWWGSSGDRRWLLLLLSCLVSAMPSSYRTSSPGMLTHIVSLTTSSSYNHENESVCRFLALTLYKNAG